jgi:hypothetical protein
MFYLFRATPVEGKPRNGEVRLVRSSDEGKTWSAPLQVTDPADNVVIENGHVIRLRSGRILVPVALHNPPLGFHGTVMFLMSDDDGQTWFEASRRLNGPSPEWSESGLQEPMAFETEEGRIRTFARTDLGCQYEMYSDDGGITWTDPMPNRQFTSPCSPMMMKKAGKYTIVLINPIPRYTTATYGIVDDRSPLLCMASEDGGKTFPIMHAIDNRLHCCYPDLFDGGNYFLVGYQQLNDGEIKKVLFEEFFW